MENRKSSDEKKTASENGKAGFRDELGDIFDRLTRGEENLQVQKLVELLQDRGISKKDPRIQNRLHTFRTEDEREGSGLDRATFIQLLQQKDAGVIVKALKNELVIPDFGTFSKQIEDIFERTKKNTDGEPDETVPHPAPDRQPAYAVSICTVDGQLLQLGDHDLDFVIQSICKPLNYAIAVKEVGKDKLHQHVGVEPGSESFESSMMLNEQDLPHNPMITSGAIMSTSFIQPQKEVDERLKHVMKIWGEITGDKEVSYNNDSFEAERRNADKHYALSYLMRQREAFAEDVKLEPLIDFYLKCCAIEVNIDDLAHAAATFANYGECPTTKKKVFDHDTVRDTLSLMHSSGMYDHSGDFAFRVGLPAKSGIGGGIMVVVPSLMGIAVYSPPLDVHGNSVRGVEFCESLANTFNFHKFDAVGIDIHGKKDPRK